MQNEGLDQSEWLLFSGKTETPEGSTGTQYETFTFNQSDPKLRDGARLEIAPGGRTPVQYITEDIVFREIPASGRLVFLHVNAEGKFELTYHDSANQKTPVWHEVKKGETMCWFVPKELDEPSIVMEWETPGFNSFEGKKCYKVVEYGFSTENGKEGYEAFWSVIDLIDSVE